MYFDDREVALYALRCHLELLTHFSLTSNGRRYFIQNDIIDQLINILTQDALFENACENEELFYADVAVIAFALLLLCNLAYEKQFFSILKKKDFQYIYSKLASAKDPTIKFAHQTLSAILSQDKISEANEPMNLKKRLAEDLEKHIVEKQLKEKSGFAKTLAEEAPQVKLRFINDTFLNNLQREIEHLSTTEYDSNKLKYKNAGRRVRVVAAQETSEVEPLLDPIIKCLESNFYLKVYENIDLSQTKAKSGVVSNNRCLAAKHLFFMRECPEFLIRHDYKRRKDIANTLGRTMLENTETIFKQHLSILIGDEGKQNIDDTRAVCITALSYHIKLLNHFALIRSIRKEILSLPIVNQILSVLEDQSLLDTRGRIDDAKIGMVAQSLTLLYNLGVEPEILTTFKAKNLSNICLKLRVVKDKIIHLMSQMLLIMLDKNTFEDIYEPHLLSKTCIEYIEWSLREPRQVYQGIKLHHLLKHLEILAQNDTFNECLAEEKQGIPVVTKCVCVLKPPEKNPERRRFDNVNPETKSSSDEDRKEILQQIQKSAVFIIWKLSFYGPKTITKLKSNDLFIEQILTLLNGTSKKSRQNAKAIIWRLGNEKRIRLELAKKEKTQLADQDDIKDLDQLISTDEWDESVPYDIVLSYSNNVNDKILTDKICKRLVSRGYQIYSEKQGAHRLQRIEKAVEKQKPILVCLSSAYRTSKMCMAELEHAVKQRSSVIPVIVEANYKIQGWLQHILKGKKPIDLTSLVTKKFNEELLKLFEEIEKTKSSD
ncbi:unnamed protein product [Rotaria sp. Silwood1]|nr:unnamed protein product [Rotaria sp. Silwood1]CAF1635258.1 unnamed protein product [Rotaria sp. Silwood1]